LHFPHNPFLSKFFSLDLPLNNLEKFVNDVEEFFSEKFLNAAMERNKQREDMDKYDRDDDDKEDLSWLFFTGDYYLYASEFPNILRTSIFVSCYSFYENQLNLFCKLLHRKRNLTLSLTDIKGNGIERAQVYLKKVAQIEFPDKSQEWQFLKKCNLIRNCVVHNGGVVEENAKELMKVIHSIDFISIQYHPFEQKIELKKEFCIEVIRNMRGFWEQLSPDGFTMSYFDGLQ
jgi:hypothetical protein